MVKHDALRMDARTFRKYTGESGVGDGMAGRKDLPPSAWSFRPPAYNAVRGMSGLCGFTGRKCPGFALNWYTFPMGTGRMDAWVEMRRQYLLETCPLSFLRSAWQLSKCKMVRRIGVAENRQNARNQLHLSSEHFKHIPGKQRVASTAQRIGLTDMATDLNESCGESQEFLPDGFSTVLKHVE